MGEVIYLNRYREKENVLARMMGAKDFARLDRIQDTDVSTKERSELLWKMNSNQIVRLRRESRHKIQCLHNLYSEKAWVKRLLKNEKAKKLSNSKYYLSHVMLPYVTGIFMSIKMRKGELLSSLFCVGSKWGLD